MPVSRSARNVCSRLPSTWAPTGSAQPDPSSARNARSTVTARRVGSWSMPRSALRVRAIVVAALDGDAPLPDGGHELRRIEHLGDAIGEPEHLERGDRHDDRAAVGHLLEPGVDVAAQLDEHEVAAGPMELRPAPHRAGGDRGAERQVGERCADQRVGRGTALGERGDAEARRRCGGEVLRRVHRDVGAAVEHGELHLLGEHALAADRVQRHVAALGAVAVRVDEHELDVVTVRRAARRRRARPG